MTQPFCVIQAALLVVNSSSPDTSLPNQRMINNILEFFDSDDEHEVQVRIFTPSPPLPQQVVSYWGNIAHDGRPTSILTVFATSVETFPWADIDGEEKNDSSIHLLMIVQTLDISSMSHMVAVPWSRREVELSAT